MTSVLFTNVLIFDGTGALPYAGEVLVQGNRISRISRGARALPTAAQPARRMRTGGNPA